MILKGRFREDLWFRLNVFPILIPPLRERKADIPALLQHFIIKKTKELKLSHIPSMSPGSIDLLQKYEWPGNVRELENVVERAMILNPAGPLDFDFLATQEAKAAAGPDGTLEMITLDDVMARHIRLALSKTRGKIHGAGGAAQLLGINPNTLRNRMNKLGIAFGRKKKILMLLTIGVKKRKPPQELA